MKYLRFIYILDENNNISDLITENLYERLPYLMFVKDNKIVVNTRREKITKSSLLLDIEIMSKYKEKEYGLFETINKFSANFLKILREHNIDLNDLKGAIENGKNYHQRNNFNRQSTIIGDNFNKGYVVGA